MNKRPFISIVIILLVGLLAYFSIHRSYSDKTNEINETPTVTEAETTEASATNTSEANVTDAQDTNSGSPTIIMKKNSLKTSEGVSVEYPGEYELLNYVSVAIVDEKSKDSIYIMPIAESGHGHIKSIKGQTTVYIIAQSGEYYSFFITKNGDLGWANKRYFQSKGKITYKEFLEMIDIPENKEFFTYNGGKDFLENLHSKEASE